MLLALMWFSPKPVAVYYGVDFMGAMPAIKMSSGKLEVAPAALSPIENLPVPVNPAESIKVSGARPKEVPKAPSKALNKKLSSLQALLKDVKASVHEPKSKSESSSDRKGAEPVKAAEQTGLGQFSVSTEGGVPFPYPWYLRAIVERIDKQWQMPIAASDRTCQVAFQIDRTGVVRDPQIERSSDDSLFDQSALRAVVYASPLPPLPDAFPSNSLKVHFKFDGKP